MCADVSLLTLMLVVVSVVAGDLVLENMVMRTKKFRYTDKSDTDTLVMTSYLAVHKITRPPVRWWGVGYWRGRSSLQGEVVIMAARNCVQAEGQSIVTLSQHVRFMSHIIGQWPPNTKHDHILLEKDLQ